MRRLVLACVVCAGAASAQPAPAPPASSPPDAWQTRTTADLLLLDKIRAQPSPVQVKVGQTATFGSLTILVRSCAVRPPDVPADSAAFLEVTDSRASGAGFRGWVLANTPAIAQFEHPIYDLRLVACR